MQKQIIGAIVGGLILFIWQFLSWSMLNLHASEMAHTENQDAIMQVLSENLSEGSYFLPNVAPGTPQEQQESFMMSQEGKPWAMIQYHEQLEFKMGMNMTRGLLVNIVIVFLLIWLLLKFGALDFKSVLLSSLAVGIIAYLNISYLNSIWFDVSTIPNLVDAIVSWGLCGAWLGWWLNR